METTVSFGDFGAPVQIDPPSDGVVEQDDYLREVLGDDFLREFGGPVR